MSERLLTYIFQEKYSFILLTGHNTGYFAVKESNYMHHISSLVLSKPSQLSGNAQKSV